MRNSFSGEEKEEDEHDRDVYKISRELAEDYNIVNDEEDFVPYDMSMADSVFSAAIELLTNTGIYCKDTGRSINITNEEIVQALGTPNSLEIGRYKDNLRVSARSLMDSRPPVIIGGPMAGKVSEKNYLNLHISYALEPIVQGVYGGSLDSIDGHPVRTSSPEEMFVSLEEARLERMATKIAGREGMTLVGPSTPTISQACMLISSDELYTRNDIHKVKQHAGLKTDFETFYKSIFHQEHGNNYLSSQCQVQEENNIESPEALTIVDVAGAIQSRLVTGASLHASGVTYTDKSSSSSKEAIWAANISSIAISRNMNNYTARYCRNLSGCCTDMMFYETAAQVIGNTVCGREMLIGPIGAGGEKVDHSTGLESRFMGEVSRMALKLDLAEANDVIEMLYSKYEDRLSDAPIGKDFEECYTVNSKHDMSPTREYMELYSGIIEEIDEFYGKLF